VDTVVSVVLLLALAAPAGLAAAWFCSRGPEAMGTFFRPDRGLGWPHGVQEEEPVAWNWDHRPAAPQPSAPEEAPTPVVEPVAFRMRRGTARGGIGRDTRHPLSR
jgi:hypothetical protein